MTDNNITCNICGIILTVENRKPRYYRCKSCHFKLEKEYREKNKNDTDHITRHKASSKKFYETHKEQCNLASIKWQKEHLEEHSKHKKEYQKKYRLDHKENLKAAQKLHRSLHTELDLEKQREYDRQKYASNPNIKKKSNNKWKQANPDKKKLADKKYYKDHKEKINKQNIQWRKDHPNESKFIATKWYQNNIDQAKASAKKSAQDHPEKAKEVALRTVNRRNRDLGFIPLNSHFKDSHAHHVNNTYVIYVPNKELHKAKGMWHNQSKLETMIKINEAAFLFMNPNIYIHLIESWTLNQ